MSDADKQLEILIKTKADLDGANAAEAQLDQDTAKARVLGDAYDELGRKLPINPEGQAAGPEDEEGTQSVGARGSGNSTLEGQQPVVRDDPSAEKDSSAPTVPGLSAEIGVGGETSLSGLEKGIEKLRLAAEAMFQALRTAGNPIEGLGEGQGRSSDGEQPGFNGGDPENLAAGNGAAGLEPSAGLGEGQGDEMAGPFAERHAEAVQASGERIRAALEENTRITVLLFNRTLELVNQQNRELVEVDRKITELSGQIKSLKNV